MIQRITLILYIGGWFIEFMDSCQIELKSSSKHMARIISFVTISPFQIVMYMSFSAVICVNYLDRILLDTYSGIFYLLIPFIPLLYLSRKYKIRNYSIPLKDRAPLFYIQIIGFIGACFLYYLYPVYTGLNTEILFVFTVGYVILNTIALIITQGFKFKISLHMTGAASSITGIVVIFGWWWSWLYLFCIPIAWSRVKLEAHTKAQVISGTFLGIITLLLTFLYVGYVI